MKSKSMPSKGASGWPWDALTIVCVSLTSLVCLLYGLIFAFPQFVPARLRPATPAPVSTTLPTEALNATEAFPTLPAEWTAAFATRLTPRAVSRTPPPATTRTAAVANSPTATPSKTAAGATAALSPTVTASQPAATPATPTGTPAPPSPEATSGSPGYPAASTPPPTAPPATGYPYP